jgi:hypothetical protein
MCIYFDLKAPSQCLEDDAEDVTEKELANFCEWYSPSEAAFNPEQKSRADQALDALEAMFSDLDDQD